MLILVTGAASGLGSGTAQALAAAGHDVVLHVRNPSRIALGELRHRMYGAIYGDLAKLDETVALAEHANRLGRFDAVIHNAGVLDAGDVLTVNTLAGHATQVWLATADDVDPPTGGYWYHRHVQDPHPATRDVAFQTELIRALEVRTGITLD